MRCIRDVKELRTELQGALSLRGEFKVLENSKIEIHLAGSDAGVSAKVAERETVRQAEGIDVKEPAQSA